ncbi:MAG: UvrB/UvrC motif-containing protein [Lachnospiraceae bacterium]|nr:UvrB/UvrC motif-containing protein [Lachnospiraceae bacterium]
MICGICKVREARIFYTEIINGEKNEQYLCEECAAKNTHFRIKTPFADQELSLGGLLSGLLEETLEKQKNEQESEGTAVLACPHCGLTYGEFRQKGQFGCAGCYQSFGKRLERSIKKIHGADLHTGKQPKHMDGPREPVKEELPELSEAERLSMRLQQALEQEDYETAAVLRDRIRECRAKEAAHE